MSKIKTPQNDYPYVRAWARLMGSYTYYITAQVEQARQDGAPQTAIFRRTPAPHEVKDWEQKDRASLWATIDPTVAPDTFSHTVLERVKYDFNLTYEDVAAWDVKANEKA